jgi:serine/threonine-protein kinase
MSEQLAAARDPLLGALVEGRYLVQSVIGRGGMGVVYAAVHEELQRAVAIKVLNPAWAADADATARFLREARVASSLSHANIIDVWDLGRLPDGRPYLVMPRVAGEDLGTLLADAGPQHPRRVVKLLEGVAAALDLIHDKGFVHRDIKPENLLRVVREDGSEAVLVLDFGIAAAVLSESRMTQDGVLCGTPDFLPPEVLTGELPDRRGDVYALATVAFELMTGRLPFQGVNPFQLLTLKLAQAAPSLSSMSGRVFPEAIEHVIGRGLAQSPEERYGTAGEFVHALGTAAEQAQDQLPDLSTADTARHPLRQSAFIRRTAPAAEPAPAPAPPAPRVHRSSPPQVLIVDEDDLDLDSLMPPLHRRGNRSGVLLVLALVLIGGGVYWTLRAQRSSPAEPAAQAPAAEAPASAPVEIPVSPAQQAGGLAATPSSPAAGPAPVPAPTPEPPVAPSLPPVGVAPPATPEVAAAAPPAAERRSEDRREDRRARRRAAEEEADEQQLEAAAAAVASLPAAPPTPPPPLTVLSIEPSAEPAPSAPAPAAAAGPPPAPQPPVEMRAHQLTAQATQAMLQGQLTSALGLYQRALHADRNHAAAWRGRGLVLQQLGRTREAVSALREFLRLEPTGAQSQMIRARLKSIEEANGL